MNTYFGSCGCAAVNAHSFIHSCIRLSTKIIPASAFVRQRVGRWDWLDGPACVCMVSGLLPYAPLLLSPLASPLPSPSLLPCPSTKFPFNPPRRAPHSLCICITAWSADGHGRLTNGARAPAAAENLRVVFNCASARAVALVAVLRDHGVRSGRGAGARAAGFGVIYSGCHHF